MARHLLPVQCQRVSFGSFFVCRVRKRAAICATLPSNFRRGSLGTRRYFRVRFSGPLCGARVALKRTRRRNARASPPVSPGDGHKTRGHSGGTPERSADAVYAGLRDSGRSGSASPSESVWTRVERTARRPEKCKAYGSPTLNRKNCELRASITWFSKMNNTLVIIFQFNGLFLFCFSPPVGPSTSSRVSPRITAYSTVHVFAFVKETGPSHTFEHKNMIIAEFSLVVNLIKMH